VCWVCVQGATAVDMSRAQRGQVDTEPSQQDRIHLSTGNLLPNPHTLSYAEDRTERKMSVSIFIPVLYILSNLM